MGTVNPVQETEKEDYHTKDRCLQKKSELLRSMQNVTVHFLFQYNLSFFDEQI